MSESKMREVLSQVREALQFANDSPSGGISDTIWMPHKPQTLFDFIDEVLAAPPAPELTDDEIADAYAIGTGYQMAQSFYFLQHTDRRGSLAFARAVIAAHEAKRNGGA